MVLVTGGAQGLGSSIVHVFAQNGYDVIIGYLTNFELAVELCNKVNEKYNYNIIYCVKDDKIRSIEDINDDVYKLVKKKLG